MSCKVNPGAIQWLLGLDLEDFVAAMLLIQKLMEHDMCKNCALNMVQVTYHHARAMQKEMEERLQWHANN